VRREGSPWKGVGTVLAKETADHLTSARLWFLEALVLLAAGGAVYAATAKIRDTVSEDPFLFLSLFTVAREPLPSFVVFLGFLVPLVAIALGFDAVNGEHAHRTLPRVLAQPIYRDALLIGKFLAGLLTLAITFLALWLLVIGLGLLMVGLPPGGEEVLRGFLLLVLTVAYGGVWLALAMLFSVLFRQQATAALAALAVWLLFAVFWGMIAPLGAEVFGPAVPGPLAELERAELQQAISLRRGDARNPEPGHARPRTGVLLAAPGRSARGAAALRREPDACLATPHRPDRGRDLDLRRHVCALPAPGGACVKRGESTLLIPVGAG
jgi:ABC-2 type transport system permease protein